MNSRAASVTRLRLHRSAVVGWFVLWREIYHRAILDFCNTIGTSRISGNVRLESANWVKAGIDQVARHQPRFYESTPYKPRLSWRGSLFVDQRGQGYPARAD